MNTGTEKNSNAKILRSTKQRDAIRSAFDRGHDQSRLLSPAEVLEIAGKEVPNLGIATVYRNIKTMLEKGEIVAVVLPGQADRYALAHSLQTPHHIWIYKDGTVRFSSALFTERPDYADSFTARTYLFEK